MLFKENANALEAKNALKNSVFPKIRKKTLKNRVFPFNREASSQITHISVISDFFLDDKFFKIVIKRK